jgi:DNA-binding transcriptional LysR family regulator
MPLNLPTNLLRSFVAIVDTGSMLQATEKVFLTQSALSLQIKRLEELVQQPLFVRDGRRLLLTPTGETLLGYARRLLNLHDEALQAVQGGRYAGQVRFGTVQDFAETFLTGILARFAELHPESQVFARVAGTAELQELLERGQLDVMVGFAGPDDGYGVRTAPMRWYGEAALARRQPVPLAVLEKPCRFREAAVRTLEANGIAWRLAVETPNLSTLRSAVAAGLGITARTDLFLRDFQPADDAGLPSLPGVACILQAGQQPAGPVRRLAELTRETLETL